MFNLNNKEQIKAIINKGEKSRQLENKKHCYIRWIK